MTEKKKSLRLSAVMRDFNLGLSTLVAFLGKHGIQVEEDSNVKIDPEAYELILQEYGTPEKKQAGSTAKKSTTRTSKLPDSAPANQGDVASHKMEGDKKPATEAVEVADLEKPKLDLKVKGKILLDEKEKSQAHPQEKVSSEPDSKTQKKDSVPEQPTELKADSAGTLSEKKKEKPKAEKTPEVTEASKEEEQKTVEAKSKPTSESKVESTELQGSSTISTTADTKEETVKPPKSAKVERKNEAPKAQDKQEAQHQAQNAETRLESGVESAESTSNRPQPKVVGKIEITEQTTKHGKHKQFEAKADVKKMPEETPKTVNESNETPVFAEEAQEEKRTQAESEVYRTNVTKLAGTTVVGKIDLDSLADKTRRKPEASATPGGAIQKRRRRKKVGSSEDAQPQNVGQQQFQQRQQGQQQRNNNNAPQHDQDRRKKKNNKKQQPIPRQEITQDVVNERLKETRARLAAQSPLSKSVNYRKEKRSLLEARREEENLRNEEARKTLQVSEFVSVNELAGMMDVPVNEVIDACLGLDLMVSINQRLDGEALVLVADEFGYKVEFVGPTLEDELSNEEDRPEDLRPRIPIFSVFGHVDHGKTSLCNKITNRVKKEAGDITQSITADIVTLASGEQMVLVDTPGHEAFTAMRSRGAKIADVAIIVISAVEGVQPQTVEAMNHAASNGVHMVFAINKIDMPDANPKRVLDELANMNYLVEEYGGKYQSQEISARQGINIDKLLEKVLLEASLMELRANPTRRADAVVLESSKEKGLGSCVNVIVRNGTLHKGDRIVAGQFYGRVRSLHIPGDTNKKGVDAVGPSMPAMVIGLNGTPQAGDNLLVVETDKEAREMATKIGKIRRMQEMSSRKPISLDEIGRRIAIGNFKELNIILKADVDGSVEALSDALLKLSTEEIQVQIIFKGVGQITETDISLAESSNAVIVGFQVRPSVEAKRLAVEKNIDIHLYSIIYDAIEEIRQAMEGMLAPEVKEEILGTAEVRETFHISKVGTIAGCMVREGKILRGSKVRIIRDGIVVYTSELLTLKHFKDEAKEVSVGQECGISVKNYNDIKVGDLIEAYRETEVKRTL